VPTTDHSQRILRKSAETRTKQEVDYLQAFLLQFRPFQELSPAGLAECLSSISFEKFKPNSGSA
jgi:predicted Zn-dependent peptidase